VAVALGVAAIVAVAVVYRNPRVEHFLTGPGCTAGNGTSGIGLAPSQAAIAATIAGVAHRQAMGARAVAIAYAAAWQESKLQDLSYGDRDSVGVFQQRPSEGWGPAAKLLNPEYAATKFFAALAAVPGYRRLPVYQAAQDVQHSADGFAYAQYTDVAEQMAAAFTGGQPHAVWCWSPPPHSAPPGLSAARSGLSTSFGRLGTRVASAPHDAATLSVSTRRPALGWAVAAWLVTHAAEYHLTDVQYGGMVWRQSDSTSGWSKDTHPASASAVLAS
jgi:hypothetical protein